MSKIKELPKSSSHLLSCTQIITSVQSAVKELIENSLDSSSKVIEVKLEDYGLEKIEVKDSGTGICKSDISKIAKPHCTSKITSHLDLNQLQTYGFRGEALAALCAVSDLLITSKTAEEEFGYTYTFSHNGDILSSKPFPSTQGTTITVLNLFKNIPVRKQFYRTDKNKKEELKKIEDTLIAFGCVHTGVRFAFFHNKSLIWQKPSVNKVRDGLVAIFGNSVVDHMQNFEFNGDENEVNIEVFLPKSNAPSICGLSSSNRSIVSINKRPVRMKAIDKVLKDVFSKSSHSVGKSRYPICYISINVPPSKADVNVEPNKTIVMLHNMDTVVEQLTVILKSFYDISITENKPHEIILENTKNGASNITENFCSSESEVRKIVSTSPMKKSEITIISSPFQNSLPGKQPLNNIKKFVENKNVSKQSGVSIPVTKRLKTSATPNDIHRHINTLDSFFESSESIQSECSKLNFPQSALNRNNSSNVQTPVNVTVQRTPLNTVISSDVIESPLRIPLGKENHCVITPLNVRKSPVNELYDAIPHLNIKKSTMSAVTQNEDFSFPSENNFEGRNNMPNILNANAANSNVDLTVSNRILSNAKVNPVVSSTIIVGAVTNEQNECSHFKDDNLNFKTAKTIFSEKNIGSENSPELPSKEKLISVKDDNSLKTTVATENLNSINDIESWSRGKLPVERDLEPVVLLKPQTGESIENIIQNSDYNVQKNSKSAVTPNLRRITPFDFFCRKHRLEVASLYPEFDNHKIAEVLTEKWNRLSMEEKAVYKNMIDKNYPKDIKKKEKIGKIISNNLSKKKESSTNSKKKPKKKCIKKVIQFSMEFLKETNPPTLSKTFKEEDANIINYLAPGIWIFSRNNELCLLNTFRLQEVVIYNHLLDTYKFDSEPLKSPWILSANSLGEDAINAISKLQTVNIFSSEKLLDERITANGFEINLFRDEKELQIQLLGITKSIAFYGVQDLKEVLNHLLKKGTDVKVSDCRPSKVVFYLQSEAVRMARQCPPSKKVEDVEDLFNDMRLLPSNCKVCIHSKPFFHQICTIK